MVAANAACFDNPKWRVIAMGFSTESWFNDGQVAGTGGIDNPQRYHLMVGQPYYRFANSTSDEVAQAGGGWWVEFDQFLVIKDFARRNGYTLCDAARLFLALPYQWTRVDRLWTATLQLPLDAYAGFGKTAEVRSKPGTEGDRWTPMQHIKVRQLYIPGLVCDRTREDRKTPNLYETAFGSRSWTYAATA